MYWSISGKKNELGNCKQMFFLENCFFIIHVEIGEIWRCPRWPHGPYEDSAPKFRAIWSYMASKSPLFNISGKLTFQSSRKGLQNPPFCPGSLQDTFIIYSSISHQHMFRKYCTQTKDLENWKSENIKSRSWKVSWFVFSQRWTSK